MVRLQFQVDGRSLVVEAEPGAPLVQVLRKGLGLTGTKVGCGEGQCGACTVLLDGRPVKSCKVPVAECEGRRITTVEGLRADPGHPVHRAWLDEDVAHYGYCQTGMMMTVAALLEAKPEATPEELDLVLADHHCQCGTYKRVRRAMGSAPVEAGQPVAP